jgi:tetratricopeptide (TPR) repeat protein
LERIVVNDVRNNTFFASIHCRHADGEMIVDSRPSDAIALALRVKSPIYVERAVVEKARGLKLDSTVYGIWYHLGIVRFVRGDFNGAADAFARAQSRAPDAGELAGSTDWLWMSLSRAGRSAEAKAMLDRKPDSLKVADPEYAYVKRLRMYRGQVAPEQLITKTDTADVQLATLNFGLGNWYLVNGDKAKAKAAFEQSIKSGGWPGFGFIVSEVELRRMR